MKLSPPRILAGGCVIASLSLMLAWTITDEFAAGIFGFVMAYIAFLLVLNDPPGDK